jgi:hypothetical protein
MAIADFLITNPFRSFGGGMIGLPLLRGMCAAWQRRTNPVQTGLPQSIG